MRGVLLWLGVLATVAACGRGGRRAQRALVDGEVVEVSADDVRGALEALGYVAEGDAAPAVSGVTVHDAARAQDGTNLVVSSHGYEVSLIDMRGEVLHTWALAKADQPTRVPRAEAFRKARLLPDGEVLALVEGSWLYRLRVDGSVRWRSELHHHHDLDVAPDGTLHTLTRQMIEIARLGDAHVMEDRISVLDPATGQELRQISLLRALGSVYREQVRRRVDNGTQDVLHVNALDILPASARAAHPDWPEGSYLLSSRGLDVVAVLDPATEAVVWHQQGPWAAQHDPSLVAGGGLLVFDNHPPGPSAVVEIDPTSGEERWRWAGEGFYSACCGTAQRLENGDTLVTVTDAGQAFEVTPAGEVVWSWTSPYRVGRVRERVARLMDLVRYPPAGAMPWLAARGAPSDEGVPADAPAPPASTP